MTTDATKRWVTAALMAVAVSISVAPAACVAEQTEAPLAMGVPDATWPAIYFEPVDRLTEAAGLKPLREARPRAGVTELRVWVGFGLQSLRGLRLRREGEQWSGQHLTARYVPTEPNRPARRSDPLKASAEPVRPASGWDHLWRELDRLGVRTLPDGGTVYDNRTRDGVGYLFEVLTPDGYRAYLYSNPDQSRVKEAVAVAKIMFLLTRELGVESLYHPPTAFHQYVSDGQVVLLRRGDAYGAFRLVDQRAANHLRGEKHDRAEVHWIYRRDGRSKLDPDARGVQRGKSDIAQDEEGRAVVSFGPFRIRWSARTKGEGYLYYPDPADERPPGEQLGVAFTDRTTWERLDAADGQWAYRASYTDFSRLRPKPKAEAGEAAE